MSEDILEKRPIMHKEKQGSELLWRKEDDKHILLARHDMYVLNEFAKEVMEICDGDHTVKGIIEEIVEKYHIDENVVGEKVAKFMEFLLEKKLIYWGE